MPPTEHHLPVTARIWLWILGLALIAAALFFLIVGVKLLMLGGSWYFVIAGVGLCISGIQMIRRQPSGGYLFALVFVGTVAWSLLEVGVVFWPLVSRLFAMAIGLIVVTATLPLLRGAVNGRT